MSPLQDQQALITAAAISPNFLKSHLNEKELMCNSGDGGKNLVTVLNFVLHCCNGHLALSQKITSMCFVVFSVGFYLFEEL